jgi:senataxin
MPGRTTKYDRGLFQRLEEAGHEVHLLDTQYRMHPQISEFPRNIFDGGYLKDGANVLNPSYENPLLERVRMKLPSFHASTLNLFIVRCFVLSLKSHVFDMITLYSI